MDITKILIIIGLIVWLLPIFRFRNDEMFYFFYIYAIADPILIITSLFVNNNIFASYHVGINLLLIFSLPKLNLKYKIGILLGSIIYLLIDIKDFKEMLLFNLLLTFITFYFINNIINDVLNKKDIKFYSLILITYFITQIITKFYYYKDINFFLRLYNYCLIINMVQFTLITAIGPNLGFKLNLKWLERILPKKRTVVYTNGSSKLTVEDLKKYGLTDREIEILKLISHGYTSKEIAEKLYLSKKTIDYYRSNIRAKLNLSKKSEIFRFLKEKNLFFDPQESYQVK
ncbi:MAG: helix-turn-helix transcriptional regulator [Melioribacter sp.]|nr:helix-turn-helix transcriptional regulator [Melioribacter sp.]